MEKTVAKQRPRGTSCTRFDEFIDYIRNDIPYLNLYKLIGEISKGHTSKSDLSFAIENLGKREHIQQYMKEYMYYTDVDLCILGLSPEIKRKKTARIAISNISIVLHHHERMGHDPMVIDTWRKTVNEFKNILRNSKNDKIIDKLRM
jgi:hypothetical protein